MFEKDMRIPVLLDFYGELLTDKQKETLIFYYEDDMSLGEIAVNYDISRQGVRDFIKRGEAQLMEYERKLGLAAKFEKAKASAGVILRNAETIIEQNRSKVNSSELISMAGEIADAANEILENA